jgi:anthranilate phosphoribosyltransferase
LLSLKKYAKRKGIFLSCMIEILRRKLGNGEDMNAEEMAYFLRSAISGELTEANKIEVLTLQCNKGISPDELAFAVQFLQKKQEPTNAVDLCGTGGSGLPRINTSTLAAFVIASLGVSLAKHGNRAASGRFGSFDLLERLGITIDLSPEQSKQIFEECGLAFFFAPKCYPEMGAFSTARKCMKKPTMFNLLGPLLSPLNPKRQIIGTSNKKNVQLLSQASGKLGREKLFVVCGSDGLDEVTLTGETYIYDAHGNESVLTPEDFGFSSVPFENIAGGDAETNVRIAEDFLLGKINDSPHANLIHMNVALGLRLAEIEEDLTKGVEMSKAAVAKGKAKEKLEEVIRYSSTVY